MNVVDKRWATWRPNDSEASPACTPCASSGTKTKIETRTRTRHSAIYAAWLLTWLCFSMHDMNGPGTHCQQQVVQRGGGTHAHGLARACAYAHTIVANVSTLISSRLEPPPPKTHQITHWSPDMHRPCSKPLHILPWNLQHTWPFSLQDMVAGQRWNEKQEICNSSQTGWGGHDDRQMDHRRQEILTGMGGDAARVVNAPRAQFVNLACRRGLKVQNCTEWLLLMICRTSYRFQKLKSVKRQKGLTKTIKSKWLVKGPKWPKNCFLAFFQSPKQVCVMFGPFGVHFGQGG